MKINRHTKSILSELNQVAAQRNKDVLMENRGHHVVTSAINLLESINQYYTQEQAEFLTKRFFSAVKSGDVTRFVRAVRKIQERSTP